MRLPLIYLVLAVFTGTVHAQAPDSNHVDINGHFIGEPVTRFLRLERDAREDVDVCRRNSIRSSCQGLLAAVDGGGRAEVSTETSRDLDNPDRPVVSIEFVLDKGKVVKVSIPVDNVGEIAKKFGPPTHESIIPSRNASGTTWENHLTVWESPSVYATLYQDNNPSVQDHRPLLVMESLEEHAREDTAARVQNVATQ
jgi:hypothetical protein